MATLYKKPDSKYWYAQFFNAHGKRVSRSTRTTKKREAERIAGGMEAEERQQKQDESDLPKKFAAIIQTAAREAEVGELSLARAEELVTRLHRLANPSFKVVTVQDHLTNWIDKQERRVADTTFCSYRTMLRRMVGAFGPRVSSKPVGELTREDIESALRKIQDTSDEVTGRKIRFSTLNKDLQTLRSALNDAVDQELAKKNPATGIRQFSEHDSSERAPFSTEEVKRMIDHPETSAEWKGVILIAAHTGLRMADVVRLNHHHLHGARLKIQPSKPLNASKSVKARKPIEIPLTKPCLDFLHGRSGDFFPALKATKQSTRSSQFKRIMERAEVPDRIKTGDTEKVRSFHSLRHTFTSWLAEANVPSDIRQKLTGHSSAGVHSRYTHHDESLDRAVSSLPDFDFPGCETKRS